MVLRVSTRKKQTNAVKYSTLVLFLRLLLIRKSFNTAMPFEYKKHNADYVVDSIKYIKLALVNLEHLWYNRNVKKGKYAFLRFLCKKLLSNQKT